MSSGAAAHPSPHAASAIEALLPRIQLDSSNADGAPAPARALLWVATPEDAARASTALRLRCSYGEPLAVDLEGVNLGAAECEVCILQVAAEAADAPVMLFDITALGEAAFGPRDAGRDTLRSLLEDASVTKMLFDLRSDVASLSLRFGVKCAGVLDIQLLDVAHRLLTGARCDKVGSLGGIIDKTSHARLSEAQRVRMGDVKARAVALFAPERGGSYAVWKERPLPVLLAEYCTDAPVLFTLAASYLRACPELSPQGGSLAPALAAATARRLSSALSPGYDKSCRETMIAIDEELVTHLDALLPGGLPKRPPIECAYCHALGHEKNVCPKLKGRAPRVEGGRGGGGRGR